MCMTPSSSFNLCFYIFYFLCFLSTEISMIYLTLCGGSSAYSLLTHLGPSSCLPSLSLQASVPTSALTVTTPGLSLAPWSITCRDTTGSSATLWQPPPPPTPPPLGWPPRSTATGEDRIQHSLQIWQTCHTSIYVGLVFVIFESKHFTVLHRHWLKLQIYWTNSGISINLSVIWWFFFVLVCTLFEKVLFCQLKLLVPVVYNDPH